LEASLLSSGKLLRTSFVRLSISRFLWLFIELVVVRNGPLRNYLRNIIEKYRASVGFIYEGIPHEELPKYYNEVGFFIAPSRTEAQGVAMCEALACGTPVIATNVGRIPEFVIHGYNGILVDKPSPEKLRKAIITLVEMPIEDYCIMSQNATNFAQRTYSSEIIVPKELYLLSRSIEAYFRLFKSCL
jgi:glycosyltransferase involved in cell wall biosynthesis